MYKLLLSIRYLVKNRVTLLAVLAVTVCVFTVIVVMTVMSGLAGDFRQMNHDWTGDCVISSSWLVGFPRYKDFIDTLQKQDFVEAVSPVIKSYGLLTYRGSDYNRNIELMGIDPVRHSEVTAFEQSLHYHRQIPSQAFIPADAGRTGAVLGIDLALVRDQHGRYNHTDKMPDYSFTVSSFPLSPRGALARAGSGIVNTKVFYYGDDSHSGLAKVDGNFIYIDIDEAAALCGMNRGIDRISSIHIRFTPAVTVKGGTARIRELWRDHTESISSYKYSNLLSNVSVESWKEYRRSVMAAVETEQVMMTAVFAMIGVIAVFIIFVVFYMIVCNKTRDIGLLRSEGASRFDIIQLFLIFAFLIGLIGSAAGTGFAVLFLKNINNLEQWLYRHYGFQLWNRMVYAIDEIPNTLNWTLITAVIFFAIAACLTGGVFPGMKASKQEPVDSLRADPL